MNKIKVDVPCNHPKLIEIDKLTGITIDTDGQKGNTTEMFLWKKYTCEKCKKLITVLEAVVENIIVDDDSSN